MAEMDEALEQGGEPAADRRAGLRRAVIVVGVVVVALVALSQASRLLRRMDAFRVRQVEVVGTRYLSPHEALERSGISRSDNIFDDPAPWIALLEAHPLVAEARVRREVPGTLVLEITEVEPLALARTPALVPVDAGGRVLPIAMAAVDVDLPVLGVESRIGEDGRLADEAAIELVEVLSVLRRLAPRLADRVSEAAPAVGGGVGLRLRTPSSAELLLPRVLDTDRLAQLRLTLADLTSRDELSRVRRIDVRYRDQVVVSLTPSARS